MKRGGSATGDYGPRRERRRRVPRSHRRPYGWTVTRRVMTEPSRCETPLRLPAHAPRFARSASPPMSAPGRSGDPWPRSLRSSRATRQRSPLEESSAPGNRARNTRPRRPPRAVARKRCRHVSGAVRSASDPPGSDYPCGGAPVGSPAPPRCLCGLSGASVRKPQGRTISGLVQPCWRRPSLWKVVGRVTRAAYASDLPTP